MMPFEQNHSKSNAAHSVTTSNAASVSLQYPAPHVALVTITRPEARNAVNAEVTRELAAIVEHTEADPDTWLVILTGAGGKAFSAGADLKAVAAGQAKSLGTERGGFAGFVHYQRAKPWIAAVEGFALAGGFEMVLACDMVVAAQDAVFGLPEPARGLLAAAGGLYRLPRVLPRNIAFELIATGQQLPAARARELGLVNRVTPNGGAVAAAIELASAICANAPIAVRESLKIARAAANANEEVLRHMTAETQQSIAQTADYQEGPRAFLEKRQPNWTGT